MTAIKAASFASEIVIPTVREFRDERRSARRAYIACIVTYQLKDYLQKQGFDVESAMTCFGRAASFEVVRGICNGTKHNGWRLRRPEHIQFFPGDDIDRPPCVAGLAKCGLSRVGDRIGGREFLGIDIYDAIKSVLKTYQVHFDDLLGDVDFDEC